MSMIAISSGLFYCSMEDSLKSVEKTTQTFFSPIRVVFERKQSKKSFRGFEHSENGKGEIELLACWDVWPNDFKRVSWNKN